MTSLRLTNAIDDGADQDYNNNVTIDNSNHELDVKMPGLVRKLLIFAAIDGLVLQPAPPRNHPPTTQQAIKIDYKGNIFPLLKDRRDEATAPVSLEAHGIVGRPPILGTKLWTGTNSSI